QRFVSIFSEEKTNRGRSATTVSAARRERMGCMQSIRGREVEEKSSPVSFFLCGVLKTQISSVCAFLLDLQKCTHTFQQIPICSSSLSTPLPFAFPAFFGFR